MLNMIGYIWMVVVGAVLVEAVVLAPAGFRVWSPSVLDVTVASGRW